MNRGRRALPADNHGDGVANRRSTAVAPAARRQQPYGVQTTRRVGKAAQFVAPDVTFLKRRFTAVIEGTCCRRSLGALRVVNLEGRP